MCPDRTFTQDACGYAHGNAAGGKVLGHHRSGTDHASIANVDTPKNGDMRSEPDILANVCGQEFVRFLLDNFVRGGDSMIRG